MKLRVYSNSGMAYRLLLALMAADTIALAASFYNAAFPVIFALLLEFTAIVGMFMAFGAARASSFGTSYVKVNSRGFVTNGNERIGWGLVSTVNLSVFRTRVTTSARYRFSEVDPKVSAKMRPMSGAGYVPELTRTMYYGVLTVSSTYRDKPALEFKCRIPMLRPKSVLKRIRKIGVRNGSCASFVYHVRRTEENIAGVPAA